MSSSEAQKSTVHHATEDSTTEPTNDTARPVVTPEGAHGRIPGGGTDMRTGGALSGGDVDEDRQKLFPEAGAAPGAGADSAASGAGADSAASGSFRRDGTAVPRDPDESSYGGPLRIDDPDAR